jgi:hypothetical protein
MVTRTGGTNPAAARRWRGRPDSSPNQVHGLCLARWRTSSGLGIAQYGSGMQSRINEVSIHYVEHGTGVPLVALHGAGVDHREIEAAIEAVIPDDGYRRIYPDLPGMGRTTGTDALTCNDDVVALLAEFIDHLVDQPYLLLGHSYGGYLARGIAARRPDRGPRSGFVVSDRRKLARRAANDRGTSGCGCLQGT